MLGTSSTSSVLVLGQDGPLGTGGTIRTGRHVRLESETPMANLFLSMLDRVGASMERIGDSTGMLPQLL